MDERELFCTCGDAACPLNPRNHDKGCDLCIQKCLRLRELPSCFFKLVNPDISGLDEFTLGSFVKFYQENQGK